MLLTKILHTLTLSTLKLPDSGKMDTEAQPRKDCQRNTVKSFMTDEADSSDVVQVAASVHSPQACAMRLARKSSLPYCLLATAVRMSAVASLISWRFLADEQTQSGRIS